MAKRMGSKSSKKGSMSHECCVNCCACCDCGECKGGKTKCKCDCC